ncbi:MAG: hypothetical protein A3F31_04705 [Candidatus Levybacteria bacterium RIFCSPHIGHO2_12_FULL_38_12]|nr:MAG: hypothetical protein A2770_04390 [Candidatus Levybacteria bacterium RIFCSPHIGHO2_01_FULL_38_12]OGH21789.1 MAG: hypothetical protein A3D75_01200 [Candidatus Levybacteria bacterium RIFCSPHIGHO2_02_FULL_37_18]OGH22553.1 MAG: hypothetical protein A3F31_04705 [Candidatus Levybacteria bacterium RIFCSPHIGHO2_12_FULL_38_12]OGH33410.1 MAG: hypothetical protein A3A47_04150 [Candidatus Levybacteria bacterium RIFCSPLOWO2_01_FULL_37_20]OGH44091.1 MAG: hypothetical protein A3J14_05075 [Candidatus Lev
MNEDLEDIRKEIDEIDEELIKILARRFEAVKKIGRLKKLSGENPLDIKRWEEIISSRILRGTLVNLPSEFVKKLFGVIHNLSLDIERKS